MNPVEVKITKFPLLFQLVILSLLAGSCGKSSDSGKMFRLLDPEDTGITFSNDLEETHDMNVIVYQDFYSGGGVSVGDIDNDGLSDIFFTGNQVPARLYKNLGDMKFEDITEQAGLGRMGRGWYTGTVMVDIDSDGDLDIYVSKSGMEAPDDRANLLFINDGTGKFTEQAKEFGIDHQGFAVNAAFFDYDRDGDLDMYLVNQGPIKLKSGTAEKLRNTPHEDAGDVLYENTGNKFVDVSRQSGIYSSVIGFAHGVAIGDVNNDGWDDIFVSNDFFEYDYLYINNHDKTFTEVIKKSMPHISYYSMGNDMADFNNDALLDIVSVDMIAEGNERLYENLGGMRAFKFDKAVEMGLHYQYMTNVLHMNNGNMTFSDIGGLAGIAKTDWSWAPVFADFDNDGWKDLYVTNGIRKDIRNIDWGDIYYNLLNQTQGENAFSEKQWDMLLNSMPFEPVTNYMFRNNGDLTFSKVMDEWGMDYTSWSNGMAYGDLDNDGDLDIVVNNIDQPAFVYENKQESKHFLRLRFHGPEANPMALGTKVWIFHGKMTQFQQHYLVRGYRSSMEPVMHFGLGQDSVVTEVRVMWPDGKSSIFHDLKADRVMDINYAEAKPDIPVHEKKAVFWFYDVTDSLNVAIRHEENDMDDFRREFLLPYKLSALGPAFAMADIDGNGLEDIFLGGSFRRAAQLFLQISPLHFESVQKELWQEDRMYEDTGAVFFDADGDGDMDLYVVSGGNENTMENGLMDDRLYLNDGHGKLMKSHDMLMQVGVSGAVVRPFDFDGDGDFDLFVGGRQTPGKYPLPADSYLLENQDGKFVDITESIAPGLRGLGMVTDAVWSDFDMDGDIDLIIVGEWMPVTIFQNNDGKLIEEANQNNGLEHSSGWWWSIVSDDFDGDGDPDYIVGNMGKNYKFKIDEQHPLELFARDFDDNKSLDLVFGYHQDGKLYPVNDRYKTIRQNPELKDKLPDSHSFARATLNEIYGEEELEKSLCHTIYTLSTSYIENLGDGRFRITPLDNYAQISSIQAIVVMDVDGDDNKDIILAGNLHTIERETVRNDAGIGLWMKGDGKGHFTPMPWMKSGLYVPGEVRHMNIMKIGGNSFLMCAKNNDALQLIRIGKQAP